MKGKQATLDLAAFLDSPEARALEGLGHQDVRRIAEAFLGVCYDELGTAPRLLDGQLTHEALTQSLPGHFGPKDPLAEHVPRVLAAFFAHVGTTQMVPHAFEIRRSLDESEAEFLETVRSGRARRRAPAAPQEPLVHRAPKLGRNDPCFCGSGKKFKKCHGKGG